MTHLANAVRLGGDMDEQRPTPVDYGFSQHLPMGTSTFVLMCCAFMVLAAVVVSFLFDLLQGWGLASID